MIIVKITKTVKKFITSIPGKLREYKRIIKISRKPTKKEFIEVAKITGLGLLIVGVIGFIIQSMKTVVTLFV